MVVNDDVFLLDKRVIVDDHRGQALLPQGGYLLSDTTRQFGLTRHLSITAHITLHLSAL